MSNRNKSRLTKTDVNVICGMQRMIDAYENYICAMCGMIRHRYDLKNEPILLLADTPMDDFMNISWRELREMKKELLELKDKVEKYGAE